MKQLLAALLVGFLTLCATAAEPGKHRIVFEFVSAGDAQMESVLNNVENAQKALGADTQALVIAHGPGLALLAKTNVTHAARIQRMASRNVVFAACENTLKRKNLTREDLLPGVITVDSGVAEVVRRQAAGWAYIKSGH